MDSFSGRAAVAFFLLAEEKKNFSEEGKKEMVEGADGIDPSPLILPLKFLRIFSPSILFRLTDEKVRDNKVMVGREASNVVKCSDWGKEFSLRANFGG